MKSLLLVLFVFGTLSATIINVPQDYPTIQAGIDAASDGDTILQPDSDILQSDKMVNKGFGTTIPAVIPITEP